MPTNSTEYSKQYYRKNKQRKQALHVKRTYGVEPEDYFALIDNQDNKCAICKEECPTGQALGVDHDHSSGKVRGLLCKACNIGLGKFKDNPLLLEEAIKYLEKYGN